MNSHKIILSIVLYFFLLFGSVNAHIVINEVEFNVPGTDDGNEWVELYNDGEFDDDISGWKLVDGYYGNEVIIPTGATILGKGYYTINWSSGALINTKPENVTLYNSLGVFVDVTMTDTDTSGNENTWQRVPDGADSWVFAPGTMGASNGGTSGDDGGIPEFPGFIVPMLVVFASVSAVRRFGSF